MVKEAEHRPRRWNCAVILYTDWDISISGLLPAILDFQLPLASRSMGNSFIDFVNLENIGIAFVAVMLYTDWDISISGLWAAILDFWLPLSLHDLENSVIQILNLENICLAVGIFQLCCIHAEILVFPLWELPSWISDFRLHPTI